jgi:putative ABC transport system substrate-binding protein
MIRRREFIAGLGGAALPAMACAQQGERVRRVGVLMGYAETDQVAQARFAAFPHGLASLGWVERRNLRLDVRWAGTDVARQQSHARELVALSPEVILSSNTAATQALREATRTIPIVFVTLSDPVATGVVSNLARPEANVTGFMNWENSMAGKWLSLLKDMVPQLTQVALLFSSASPSAPFYVRVAQEAGERLAVNITAAGVRDQTDIESTIAVLAGSAHSGLLVLPDILNNSNVDTIVTLAAKYRVPAIYPSSVYASAGGLISYGPDPRLPFRDGATYVDRILRGAKPGDLPVQFATKFELGQRFRSSNHIMRPCRVCRSMCERPDHC